MKIYMNGQIGFDAKLTDYAVKHRIDRTVVYNVKTGQEIALPHRRYSLAHNSPASGRPGRAAFIRDFLAVTGANQ